MNGMLVREIVVAVGDANGALRGRRGGMLATIWQASSPLVGRFVAVSG